ncbi:hypothetical protein J4E08_05390 [Sagittula sp. NFXS13]|uniref:ElaB/YqjD/DUF883 family membrane-anchored ribosome-binding protein n=1 Tax=Sagittula marina TaxID=943940 RepID=A0A7W6DRL8_9RHOB|nr:hypothetical protein [Sagittula marina]MBB3983894.1 ElaB/YqjD/DUF883 family membrane-anchored ribosome-binding protein [Sagittula marina]
MSASKNPIRNGSGMEKATAHARDAVDSARESLEGGYTEAREHAARAFDAASESVEAAYEESALAVRDAHGQLETMVRNNPTTALLGAAGVGLLVGLALKARR